MYEEGSKINTMQSGASTQSMGKGIIARLEKLRAAALENCRSAGAAADNIVGMAPTPAGTQGTIEKDRDAGCFLEKLERVVCDMERISSETADHLSRLHRAF